MVENKGAPAWELQSSATDLSSTEKEKEVPKSTEEKSIKQQTQEETKDHKNEEEDQMKQEFTQFMAEMKKLSREDNHYT